jgi:riboflavin kinase/FMN adenylyltransferase
LANQPKRTGKNGMKIIDTISDFGKVERGGVLTVGNFDGVHIGHQEILTAGKRAAVQRKVKFMAMTFEPHPVAVLHPQKSLGVLTPLAFKKYLLAEFGVDYLFVLESRPEVLSLSPADFIERFLVKNIQPSIVVEGENFKFGSGRSGNVDTLKKLGAEGGFEVTVIGVKEVKLIGGQTAKVSSTVIRNLLEGGRVGDAAVALGRAYRLIGLVVPGRGRAKGLGFPTVNMELPKQAIPAEGVYAGFVQTGGSEEKVCPTKEKIPAALSIGRAKTFGNDNPLLIEAHILSDDVSDLSKKWVAMDFVEHIRSQQKFETKMQLSEQIAKDCEKAKKILATDFKDYTLKDES